MKRVLVTGGAGFIGSHLVRRLAREPHDVFVLDNLRRARSGEPDGLARLSGVTFIEGDIRDRNALRSATQGCDTVFHLAAQSNVLGSLVDSDYSFSTNVVGTYNVLAACLEAGVRRLVFTSSREVYGEVRCLPVGEEAPLASKNPYGASKVSGEAYLRTFSNCHGLETAIVRLANVYGNGDSQRVIPLWMQQARSGEDLLIYGGQQVLDFVWIDTVVQALMHAGEHGLPRPVNVGSGIGTPIAELAQRVLDTTPGKSRIVYRPARGAEVTRFVADVSRLRALGIEPDADPLAHLGKLVCANGHR